MKTNALVYFCVLSLGFSWSPAFAGDATSASITVKSPWLRATPKGAPVIGGYATITNSGAAPDRLIGGSVPVAARGEIHSMTMANGVMRMERLSQGLEIAPGATATLSPGGYHLMFMKPTRQIKPGESFDGTLTFEKAGTIKVTFAVAGIAAKEAPGAPADHDMSGMKGMDMKGMDMKGMDMK